METKEYKIENSERSSKDLYGQDFTFSVWFVSEYGYLWGALNYVKVLAEFGNTKDQKNLENAELFVKSLQDRDTKFNQKFLKEVNVPEYLGDSIESILCLATLTAHEMIPYDKPNDYDVKKYWQDIGEDCNNCKLMNVCLACKICE